MLRLVGLWTEPADVDAFEREYLGSHVPKLQRLPACRDVRTARCIDGPFFRLTEVHFESLDASTPRSTPPPVGRSSSRPTRWRPSSASASTCSSWPSPPDRILVVLTRSTGPPGSTSGERPASGPR